MKEVRQSKACQQFIKTLTRNGIIHGHVAIVHSSSRGEPSVVIGEYNLAIWEGHGGQFTKA